MKHVILLFLFFVSLGVQAQSERDTTGRKNGIKVDLTSYWLYRNAVVFTYERVRNPQQSWGITAGIQQLPGLGTLVDDVKVTRETKARGLKLGAEYRFYLQKENKFKAPHGVYIGPYVSFHNYANDRNIEVDNNGVIENATLSTDLNILNIGFQLGYQFLINNRWAIDLVFVGPSISNYSLKSSIEGNYTFDPDNVNNEVILGLIDRFPGFEKFINEGEITSKGKLDHWGYGYRYQLQVGYFFGRKKK